MRKQLLATLATLGMLTTAPFVLANPIEIQVNNTMSEGGSESEGGQSKKRCKAWSESQVQSLGEFGSWVSKEADLQLYSTSA